MITFYYEKTFRDRDSGFVMKRLFLILVLIFGFQSWTKANDIRDFPIEGMSIGQSLLNYYNEEKIKSNISDLTYNYIKDKTFVVAGFNAKDGRNFKKYNRVQIEFKKNDNDYIIHGLSGVVVSNYDKDIDACFKYQNKVHFELTELFSDQEERPLFIGKHPADKSGQSEVRKGGIYFKSSGHIILTECYIWHKNMQYPNAFKISLNTKELNDWLVSEH